MSTTVQEQDALLDEWREELERVSDEVRRLAEPLSEAQLRWSPGEGTWSIGQVLRHLATSTSSYLPLIREAMGRAGRGGGRRREGWKPSLMGGFLIRSLDPSSSKRLPAPRSWRPDLEVRSAVLEEFLRTQQALAELMRQAGGVDLVRTRTHSPVSRLVRLNLGDCFRVLVVHEWRHLGQMRRLRESAGFPEA